MSDTQTSALSKARHIFIGGNGLPSHWQGRDRFVVLETGFGPGTNFLATWQAWRDDPQRCEKLVFIAIDSQPFSLDELAQVHATSALRELAEVLRRAWPPLTPDLHVLDFDGGRVQLMLALGDVQTWLPELVASVDAFYLDGIDLAADAQVWSRRVCKALSRLAAPEATLASRSTDDSLRGDLKTAGFEVGRAPGVSDEPDITLARFAPSFTPRRAPARAAASKPNEDRHALIIGAGLAGCGTAWALAEQGWRTTVFDRGLQIASEASGNPAGLFHGIVNRQDGVHARFNRAAALMAREAVAVAIASHGVSGATSGLLRLEQSASADAMYETLRALGLPRDYVDALTSSAASTVAGIELPSTAWFYPGGGWVDPAGLARSWLERAGPRLELRLGTEVHSLRRTAAGWRLLDPSGKLLAEAPNVVLANAGGALDLLKALSAPHDAPAWPIESIRGQLTLMPATALALPRVPIAGAGYLLPDLSIGLAMFGSTSQRGDADASVRAADHRDNLAQLARLVGHEVDADIACLSGRTAWRWSATDRLPVIGAVPDELIKAQRLDQPRFVPRIPGLYVFTALGSRGITWSALGARLLAANITGAPMPLGSSIIDAIDPARFVSRRARQG